MRTYAIIDNNIVTEVLDLDDSGVIMEAAYHQLIIDVTDTIPQPQAGWVLDGNTLVMATAEMTQEERDLFQQQAQRKFGTYLCGIATDLVGARNLKLTRESIPVDVALLASQMLSLKTLMEGGALKTVRGLCYVMKTAHPNHADILDQVIGQITSFLVNNGWN